MPKTRQRTKNENAVSALEELSVRSPKKKKSDDKVHKYIKNSSIFPNKEKNKLLKNHNHIINKGGKGFNIKFIKKHENEFNNIAKMEAEIKAKEKTINILKKRIKQNLPKKNNVRKLNKEERSVYNFIMGYKVNL